MKAGWLLWFGLALVNGCTRSAGEAGQDRPAHSAITSAGSASAPIAVAPCGPDAYRHEGPDFCAELPASARGKAPMVIENGVAFPDVIFTWTPKSNAAAVAEWKTPKVLDHHHGPFEIWTTEPIPGGTYFLIYDATQHDTAEVAKIPSVRGLAVVEGETMVVRCVVTVNLEPQDDPRAMAASHATELAACKSLRVFGR
ncbi:hypothetical protein [Polyangium jinanense]|uniref:Uncharacterized protein n=1 Tax=Polyangium jinanense TaxID=2829994 RepID=A0A9X3X9U4_9BACT|nr:hypothetical protein [Polyangium jinanense]MDC3958991.1 hypothetical protein [Polyangium jinanense]MDC3986384.1 hypothetical protein [Polyangium jinanense]